MEYLSGYRIRQCDQSNEAFGQHACCGANDFLVVDPHCDAPWYPEFLKWGYRFNHQVSQALSWTVVTAEIDARRPIAFAWIPGTSASQPIQISHMMVLIGYNEDATGYRTVTYLNPRPFSPAEAEIVAFTDYEGTTGYYVHREDYFAIRPTTSP